MPFSLQRSELTKKLVSTSSKAGIPYPMLTLVLLLSIPSESGITTVLIIACVAFAILAGLRLRLGQDISKESKAKISVRCQYAYRSTLFATSVLWGFVTAYTVWHLKMGPESHLIIFACGGIAAGGLATLSPSLSIIRAHITATLLPLMTVLMFMPSAEAPVYSAMIFIFFGYLLSQTKAVSTTYMREFEHNQQLQDAKTELTKAMKVKSQFLATMSHEIRTPLNGIIGMNRLILDRDLGEEERELAKTVQDCSEHLLTIINSILDFSKLEAEKIELEHEPFDLKELINESLRVVEPLVAEKDLVLESQVFGALPRSFLGDSSRLRQVLINFLSNAVKFTEKGSIRIEASWKPDANDRAEVTIHVRDTGVGIPDDSKERLFQSFSQADSSIARKYGGTGLGLAINKSLIELMGGRTWFETEVGVGTTFSFSILLEASDRAPNKKPNEGSIFESGKDLPPPSLRILVAEDNLVNQKLMLQLLKKFGYTVDIAEDGGEAIEYTKAKQYDLIFMDMQMPRVSGIDAAIQILKDHGERAPRIIAVTANASTEDRRRCLEAGMHDFISKPIQVSELKSVIFNSFPNSATGDRPSADTQPGRLESQKIGDLPFFPLELLENMGEDEDLVRSYVEAYLEDSPLQTIQLLHAIEDYDMEIVERSAHTLKGQLAGLCASRAKDLAFSIELAAKDELSKEKLNRMATHLTKEMDHLKRHLQSYYRLDQAS